MSFLSFCLRIVERDKMHDIWNPWHGCIKKSEGCRYCYMYFLDKQRNMDGARVFKVKNNFDYPLHKDKNGNYKIKSGEQIRVCMTSDFFLEDADKWRQDAWKIMRQRSDVIFYLLTKRPERVAQCLPDDWNNGWENIFFNVTCENQVRADERIPILLKLPFKHKGIMAAPFIGRVKIAKYLQSGQIEQVIAGGENYDGARPLYYQWVKELYDDCVQYNVTFCFIETGSVFVKDGKTYNIPDKRKQSVQAWRSGLQYIGKPMVFNLKDGGQMALFDDEQYRPYFGPRCKCCASKIICNGCSRCGACDKKSSAKAELSSLVFQTK